MKQTDLDLLIRCQKKIKEAMGEWQDGDAYYLPHTVPPTYGYYSNHCESCKFEATLEESLRIPPSFPTLNERPERSLWGMIAKTKSLLEYESGKSLVLVSRKRGKDMDFMPREYFADNPYTAMLMALCEQWEV